MKRATAITCFLMLGIALAAALVWYFALRRTDAPNDDPSIQLSEPFQTVHGLTVENGSAFDNAAVDIESYKKLVVPDDAEVREGGGGHRLQVFMKKTLGFGGHPPSPMSIRTDRKYMGCALKAEDGTLVLATFGEWDSRIEGGADMRLVLVVPANTEVEKRPGLSGPRSAGREWHGKYLTKPKEVKDGYWYGPATPADGWTRVPDVPDTERTAGK
jgi:hypothetical protein